MRVDRTAWEKAARDAIEKRLRARGFSVDDGEIAWKGMRLGSLHIHDYGSNLYVGAELGTRPGESSWMRGESRISRNACRRRPDAKRFANILAKKLAELRTQMGEEEAERVHDA